MTTACTAQQHWRALGGVITVCCLAGAPCGGVACDLRLPLQNWTNIASSFYMGTAGPGSFELCNGHTASERQQERG